MSLIISGTETLTVTLDAAPASNQLQCTSSWANQSGVAGDSGMLTTGVTAVVLVAAPGAGVVRVVAGVTVYNADTAARGVTVSKGSFTVIRATIQPGCHLLYDNANGWKVVDATGSVVNASVQTSNVQPGDGLNLLVDGSIAVNQAVFAGGAVAAGVYGYDMWKGGTGGGNVTVNATTGVITHTSGTISSVIEAPRIAGQQVAISITQNTAVAVTVGIDGVTATIPAVIGRQSAILTVPSGSTGNPVFSITATGASYSDIKVERGNVATPFRYKLRSELITAVQRYFEKTYDYATAIGALTSTGIFYFQIGGLSSSTRVVTVNLTMKVSKATNPAVTLYSFATGASGKARDVIAGADLTATASNGQNNVTTDVTTTVAGTTTAIAVHAVFDARL